MGVIANLAVYFATHTLFAQTRELDVGPLRLDVPVFTSLEPLALVIGTLAMVMIFRLRWSVLRTLGVCAVLGLAGSLLLA